MQIIELTKEQFDEFAFSHKNHNFYQTSQYGSLMNRHSFTDIYVGLLNDDNKLTGASLILTQKKFGRFKSGYAPRGFLIDFEDLNMVNYFTRLLRDYLNRLGIVYVKIDPLIVNIQRDDDGMTVVGGINNSHLIDFLKSLNYEHKGYNLYFETMKPRWNAITPLSNPSDKLFASFDKQTKNKIRKSFKRGVTVYKGTRDEIKLFYSFLDKKHAKKLSYYLDEFEIFKKNDMYELYFAKLDPKIYMETSKELYESELQTNTKYNELVQKSTKGDGTNDYINLKMNSDKLLAAYKSEIVNANNMYQSYPNGVVIAATSVIKYNQEVYFLDGGYNQKFKSFSANHLMKWAIINEFTRKGFAFANHNAISGNFDPKDPYYGLYQFKKGFNSNIVEYIGEFDLVINNGVYHAYQKIKLLKKLFDFKK